MVSDIIERWKASAY